MFNNHKSNNLYYFKTYTKTEQMRITPNSEIIKTLAIYHDIAIFPRSPYNQITRKEER